VQLKSPIPGEKHGVSIIPQGEDEMKHRTLTAPIALAIVLSSALTTQAHAGPEPFIGEIMWVGYNFCPRGWAEASGQLLPIAQNTALFSLYGTFYGGDGRTTFALPDLRGRVSVHAGQGPGLSNYPQGSKGGQERVTLAVSELPAHNHAVNASSDATDKNAAGSVPGSPKQRIYDSPLKVDTTWDTSAVGMTGDATPHENRGPYVTLRACVALQGIYPSRN
jgi:microcystin-dependent protein